MIGLNALMSGLEVSYSATSFSPYFRMLYSIPPKIAAGPENQLPMRKSPPKPNSPDLLLKPSSNEVSGFLIELSEPRIPKPIPDVKSKFPIDFVATIYSEEKLHYLKTKTFIVHILIMLFFLNFY